MEGPEAKAGTEMVALRAISWTDGTPLPRGVAGNYICRYNPDTSGDVDIRCSPDIAQALLFSSVADLTAIAVEICFHVEEET
jgi:hypothetical protein